MSQEFTATSQRYHQLFLQELAVQSKSSKEELREFKITCQEKNQNFQEQAIKAKLLTEKQYQIALTKVSGYTFHEFLPLIQEELSKLFSTTIPIRYAKKYLFFPISTTVDKVTFIAKEAWPIQHFETAAQAMGKEFWEVVIGVESTIAEAINRGYDRASGSAGEAAEVLESDEELIDLLEILDETEDLLDADDEEPIKKLMNSILFQAIKENSSDIHFDPTQTATHIKARVDGVLREITQVAKQGHIPLINRIKVMSGLDISTKNQPQDGRSMVKLGGKMIDIRVSIIPTVHGERAVLRLLNQSQGILPLEKLGIPEGLRQKLDQLIHRPHGIVLVTGPTGSGKTTTLYSCLNQINASEKNVVTIEDPVEYRISEYGQMQVNEKIGVTFSKGLRAMLRQDPDVIMVGEMRDAETAQIAIQAALTGHLVFSTLHTNDAASSIVRLLDMGTEAFLVSSTIAGILAQRLVRTICLNCKESYELEKAEIDQISLLKKQKDSLNTTVYRGRGCANCNHTGYQGRIGVYELLVMTDKVRHCIAQGGDASQIREIALQEGMFSLQEDATQKVNLGITTLEEMLRVVYHES